MMKRRVFLCLMAVILIIFSCVAFFSSCQSIKQTTLQINNELDPKTLDASDIANEVVAPMYLPQELNGKQANLSYEKTGLTAAIKADEVVLASFIFSKIEGDEESKDYPSAAGEAYVSQDGDRVTIQYRMSASWVCKITSDYISASELEKVLNSMTIRSVP